MNGTGIEADIAKFEEQLDLDISAAALGGVAQYAVSVIRQKYEDIVYGYHASEPAMRVRRGFDEQNLVQSYDVATKTLTIEDDHPWSPHAGRAFTDYAINGASGHPEGLLSDAIEEGWESAVMDKHGLEGYGWHGPGPRPYMKESEKAVPWNDLMQAEMKKRGY